MIAVRSVVGELVAAEIDVLLRKFNPLQPRDTEGKFAETLGGGPQDALGLTKRITLSEGESFVASESGKTSSGADEYGIPMALINTPDGPQLLLSEETNGEATSWDPGTESLATLDLAQMREFRDGLNALATEWASEQEKARAAGRAYEAAGIAERETLVKRPPTAEELADRPGVTHGWDSIYDPPLSPREQQIEAEYGRYVGADLENPVASGVLTGDIGWALRGIDGDDYGHERLFAHMFIGRPTTGSPQFASQRSLRAYQARLDKMIQLAQRLEAGETLAAERGEGVSVAVRPEVRAIVRDLLRKFDPNQPRDPDGKFSKIGAIKGALAALAGDDAQHITGAYGTAAFDGDRHVEWEADDSGDFTVYFNPGDLGDGDEQITLNLDPQAMQSFTSQLGMTLLASEKPPFDPNDRASILLHSMLATNGTGAGHTNDDDSYIDVSSSGSGFLLEFGDGVNEAQQMELSKEELAKLHAALLLTQMAGRPGLGADRSRKFNPLQPREKDGKWGDGVPDVDIDLGEDDEDGEEEDLRDEVELELDDISSRVPAEYRDKYGKVIFQSNITGERDAEGDLIDSTMLDVVVTEKRGFHIALGIDDRKVLQELDPLSARVLADIVWDIDDDELALPFTDNDLTGISFDRADGGDYQVTWTDGSKSTIEPNYFTDMAEALRSGVNTWEREFGKRSIHRVKAARCTRSRRARTSR